MKFKKKNIGKKKGFISLKRLGDMLPDKGISCPIPMIYLEDGKVVPVEKSELPVELPEDIDLNTQGNLFRKSSNLEKYVSKIYRKKSYERNRYFRYIC